MFRGFLGVGEMVDYQRNDWCTSLAPDPVPVAQEEAMCVRERMENVAPKSE